MTLIARVILHDIVTSHYLYFMCKDLENDILEMIMI